MEKKTIKNKAVRKKKAIKKQELEKEKYNLPVNALAVHNAVMREINKAKKKNEK